MKSRRHYRTITRTYTSKRTGKTKTYVYKYDVYKVQGKRVHRGTKNIMYRGKITKYGAKWIEEYKRGLDVSDRNELEAQLLSGEKNKRTITSTSMVSRMQEDSTSRFIYNMGGDVNDLSKELDVDYDELINKENWDFKQSTFSYKGKTYQFYFEYESHELRWELV